MNIQLLTQASVDVSTSVLLLSSATPRTWYAMSKKAKWFFSSISLLI
jgi:hypothetical protein